MENEIVYTQAEAEAIARGVTLPAHAAPVDAKWEADMAKEREKILHPKEEDIEAANKIEILEDEAVEEEDEEDEPVIVLPPAKEEDKDKKFNFGN